MVKVFCDECGKELTVQEIKFCNDMIGKHLCTEHANEMLKQQGNVTYNNRKPWVPKWL